MVMIKTDLDNYLPANEWLKYYTNSLRDAGYTEEQIDFRVKELKKRLKWRINNMLSTEVERIKNGLSNLSMKLLYNMTMEEFINQLLENYNSMEDE